ncbi:MAG: sigma-54-dependent Fis family transcriptional regulator [Paludibacteraceae bacterium]|nr:sigma-54-dependent Fis family transcriptional regulator [Paludibacteraceae bacterium]
MKKRILIVEDNITLSQIVKDWLEREGYAVATAIDEPYARKLLRKESFDLILSDVRLPQGDGISLLEWINKEKMDIPFVIMTEYASVTDAVKAIKLGAKDYLSKPVFHEQVVEMVKELLKPVSTVRSKEKELFKRTSPKAKEAMNMAELVAPSDISVLILGANGTGKESVARTIHFHSNRKDMPFVAVNCGAIPRELAASMFFGHTKGAFTGADTDKGGYFDAAKGGTLFLDEIGTLPFDMQSSLLRVLQEGTFMPVGSSKERVADVRIVAATNENMEKAIADGRFREDLYHRLGEFEIRQPSLAECPEDILPLADFFREKFSSELRKATEGFTEEAEQLLLSHTWSGNIRELQNKIRRAVLMAKDTLIDYADLNIAQAKPIETPEAPLLPLKDEELEKQSIIRALQSCGGNKSKTAKMLNVDSSTLYRKMKKYGVK